MSADAASEAARGPALPARWLRRVRHASARPTETEPASDSQPDSAARAAGDSAGDSATRGATDSAGDSATGATGDSAADSAPKAPPQPVAIPPLDLPALEERS